jgi:hypothetical protein
MRSKLSPQVKKMWADKTLDLTNIGAGATIFGQFIGNQGFSWLATLVGLIVIVSGYIVSYFLYEE